MALPMLESMQPITSGARSSKVRKRFERYSSNASRITADLLVCCFRAMALSFMARESGNASDTVFISILLNYRYVAMVIHKPEAGKVFRRMGTVASVKSTHTTAL